MKVVILAAGQGIRMFHDFPKTLLPLDDISTILSRLVDQLTEFIDLRSIIVVIGYEKEKISSQFPDLSYVHNPLFATENTAKSLERALHNLDEDILWINGDVVCREKVLAHLIQQQQTAMVVHRGDVGEEEIKFRATAEGRILAVSKEMHNPMGEAVGIQYWQKEDLPLLKKKLKTCASSDYFERAIEECIAEGMSVQAWEIDPHDAIEVDFPEDWKEARRRIQKWKSL